MKKSDLLIILTAFLCAVVSCSSGSKEGPDPKPAESIVSIPSSLSFAQTGGSDIISLVASSDWTATGPEWVTLTPSSGKGGKEKVTIDVSADKNNSDARNGEIVFALSSGKNTKVAVSQAGGSLSGKNFVVCANSMVYYGGFVKGTGTAVKDQGMFQKLMKANGMDVTVYNCTQGGHYLRDFLPAGCKNDDKSCKGKDHMAGVPFDKIDYIILSEAGTNTQDFLEAARGICKRVTDRNPNAKKIYINHVYSVYKNHSNILNNLKTLHDKDGFTIVNCGQLAYDIYTRKVSVPGGSLTYSDRYTFCNHTGSDTYHPNPLMGYIMTQMLYCAVTGQDADYADYSSLIKGCYFSSGSVSYDSYYNKYYTTPAALPFMTVIDNSAEMKGIQKLIPQYINKY